MRRGPAAALLAALALGCAPALHPPSVIPDEAVGPAALAARVHALVGEVRLERSSGRRAALATEAVAVGQRCVEAAGRAPAPGDPGTGAGCDYALALALGLQAREHPSTFREGLAEMVLRLRRAAAAAPELDRAGPHRVLALVLLRAPGWPLGPGDPEEGLAEARQAVARAPDHAPNQLALAEALSANGEAAPAQVAARRAMALAEAAQAAGEPEAGDWVAEARRLAHAP